MFATGHQQGTQVQICHQLGALGHQVGLVGATTDDGFKLTEIWRNQAGATVDREILALGIGQHRNAPGTCGLDQHLMVFQGTLAVVGQHQHLDAFKQVFNFSAQRQGVGGKRFFEIDTQQLLVTAHDPQLDDGRLVRNTLEQCTNTRTLEPVGQAVGGFVVAGHPHQRGRRAQCSDVERNVGSAARAVFDLLDLDHRHRRLRGNP